MSNFSTVEDRLEYFYLNLIGQVIRVYTVDGAITEGLFLSRTDDDQLVHEGSTDSPDEGIFLRHYRRCKSEHHSMADSAQLVLGDALFYFKDIIYVEVPNLKIRTQNPGSGQVQNFRGTFNLEKLDWAGKDELLETDGNEKGGEWDQFKANEKFGVQSTYNENKYTTELKPNEFSVEQRRRAEEIAQEIENSPATFGEAHRIDRGENLLEDDATLYSDVRRDENSASAPPPGKGAKSRQAPFPGPNPRNGKPLGPATTGRGARADPSYNGGSLPGSMHPGGRGSPSSLDLSAQPFKPQRPIFDDFLRAVATSIRQDEASYRQQANWPGDSELNPTQLNGSMPGGIPPTQGSMGPAHGMMGNPPLMPHGGPMMNGGYSNSTMPHVNNHVQGQGMYHGMHGASHHPASHGSQHMMHSNHSHHASSGIPQTGGGGYHSLYPGPMNHGNNGFVHTSLPTPPPLRRGGPLPSSSQAPTQGTPGYGNYAVGMDSQMPGVGMHNIPQGGVSGMSGSMGHNSIHQGNGMLGNPSGMPLVPNLNGAPGGSRQQKSSQPQQPVAVSSGSAVNQLPSNTIPNGNGLHPSTMPTTTSQDGTALKGGGAAPAPSHGAAGANTSVVGKKLRRGGISRDTTDKKLSK